MNFYGYDRRTLEALQKVLSYEYELRCRDVIMNPRISDDSEDIRYRSGVLCGLRFTMDKINELLDGQGEEDYE